jgi:ABC-type phosphate transport system substrate-binding protein
MKLSKQYRHAALCALLGTVLPVSAWAGVAVIVNPANTNTISEDDISKIFLGKRKAFPNGSEAIPVDLAEGAAARTQFVTTVLKKNDQQIKAYWAQLLFTGKGTPPKEVSSDANVKQLVADNPALIGYISSDQVDASVKVVHQF